MRKFALVVLGVDDVEIDRFNIDIVESVDVGGINLSMSLIQTDLEDTITKVVQTKSKVKFSTIWKNYTTSQLFAQWIEKYSTVGYKMALEYSVNNNIHYAEGRVTNLTKTEMNEYHVLERTFTFQTTTAFFEKIKNVITIKTSSVGKSYPFKYPYMYGKNEIRNNLIDNQYILSIPLIVKVYGAISNPHISLLDENGNIYNEVEFLDLILYEGDYLIINSAEQKIYYYNHITDKLIDYTAEANPSYDTFLRAEKGKSTLAINLEATNTGYVEGGWRAYSIDA